MFILSHNIFPQFRNLCCHTSRFQVFKFFYYNTVLSQIKMFVLPHNMLFHIAPLVKRRQFTKYQLYRRSKKVLFFYPKQMFWGLRYTTHNDYAWRWSCHFLRIQKKHWKNDSLHVTKCISKWQLVPFYKTEAILKYLYCHTVYFVNILGVIQAI
jgi:hypothetical protein